MNIDNNIINIKQWGAYGDGEHDDSTLIQKAINYCYASNNAKYYNGKKLYIPKGKFLIKKPLIFISTTLQSAEYSNICVEGDGQGISNFIIDFTENGSAFSISTSSKFSISNISLKNISNNEYNVDGLTFSGAPMMIDIKNIFVFNFYRGFYSTICVGNFSNCLANSCTCGFHLRGTANTVSNCYASQSKIKNNENPEDFEGCGYYIGNSYSTYIACAADNNVTAYKIVGRLAVTLQNCGAEANTNNIIIDDTYTSINTSVVIDNFGLVSSNNKQFLTILHASRVLLKNIRFDLSAFNIEVADNLPANVLELDNITTWVNNSSQYPNVVYLPINNRARDRGIIYEFDGNVQEGKGRLYKSSVRELKWRTNKTGVGNGQWARMEIHVKNSHLTGNPPIIANECLLFYYIHSTGSYISSASPVYDNTKFTLTADGTDTDYNYYTLTWENSTFNTGLIFDIDIITNLRAEINNPSVARLLEIEGLDYDAATD